MELNKALFTSSIPHERTLALTLDSGETVSQVFYIREISSLEMRKQVLAERSDDQQRVEMALSNLIAKAVCDADGQAVMTVDQASQLKPLVGGQLRDIIMEVNGLGKMTGVMETPPE